jgi:hypothetical protein
MVVLGTCGLKHISQQNTKGRVKGRYPYRITIEWYLTNSPSVPAMDQQEEEEAEPAFV